MDNWTGNFIRFVDRTGTTITSMGLNAVRGLWSREPGNSFKVDWREFSNKFSKVTRSIMCCRVVATKINKEDERVLHCFESFWIGNQLPTVIDNDYRSRSLDYI